MYLEPWHVDVLHFLEMKKNHGAEEERARDLFYALWIPDLFMRRVEADEQWALFCPNEAPGLFDSYGDKFEQLYAQYEQTPGKPRKIIRARQLWQQILESQQETGTPYMLFKDAANSKSNQKNLGTIHCSNLCTEIIEYTSKDEIAVCNLASIALPMFVNRETRTFDHDKLFEITQVVARNLNKIIDINYYPVAQAEYSNKKNRPIGLGVQGLADAFILMRLPFDSPEAQTLNKHIFETIYYAALTASCQLAKQLGPYDSYPGSPISQGILQFDMWSVTPDSGRWDWDKLRADIKLHGVRNSLLLAPMPTATTSQILGNNEVRQATAQSTLLTWLLIGCFVDGRSAHHCLRCSDLCAVCCATACYLQAFEPYTSNIYVRRTLAGEFVCVSRHLLCDLIALSLWTPQLKDEIIAANGSIQHIASIPQHIKQLYRTVWEISQKSIIDMAADRGAYIDQSQSLNIHMTNVNAAKLTSMHFYAWKKGLKTGMYYLRTKSATDAIKFTLDPNAVKLANANKQNTLAAVSEQQKEQSMDTAFALPQPVAVPAPSSPSSSPPLSLATALPSLLTPAGVDEESVVAWKAERARNRELMECSLINKDQCTMCSS